MLEFMDYVLSSFNAATRWDVDNSYASLTDTASSLLDCSIPNGALLHVSSLSSRNFATSYTLGSKGVVDGSLSFLYSSLDLQVASSSREISLVDVVRGYRHLQALRQPDRPLSPGRWYRGLQTDRPDTLLFGRLYLPASTLHALYLRRLSPTKLLKLTCVSDSSLPNSGTLLAQLQNDCGKYSHEYLWSTDSSLVGVRALYNFGFDPRSSPADRPSDRAPRHPWDNQDGRLSLGGELYFSPLNKSGGLSTGLRFTTLPGHTGTPYTMTLTLNPLMGNLSSTYAVKAGDNLALCSKFDFNVYSYESDVSVGLELWRQKQVTDGTDWVKRMIRPGWEVPLDVSRPVRTDDSSNVVKARVGVDGKVGLLWEGKIKELIVSAGAAFEFKQRDKMLGSLGCEISYST